MKIKIDPKTLKITYLEGDVAPGFYIGELLLDSGRPPILKISHPNHKTVTKKAEIKVVFEDFHIVVLSHYPERRITEDSVCILWPDGIDSLKMLLKEVSKYLPEIGVPYKEKKRFFVGFD